MKNGYHEEWKNLLRATFSSSIYQLLRLSLIRKLHDFLDWRPSCFLHWPVRVMIGVFFFCYGARFYCLEFNSISTYTLREFYFQCEVRAIIQDPEIKRKSSVTMEDKEDPTLIISREISTWNARSLISRSIESTKPQTDFFCHRMNFCWLHIDRTFSILQVTLVLLVCNTSTLIFLV